MDESRISGKPIPVTKREGGTVVGATINGTGSLRVPVVKVGADTVLAQIIRLVQHAQASMTPIQRLADAISARFVPTVIAIAIGAFAVWFIAGPPPAPTRALVSAAVVLIITGPCAHWPGHALSIMVGTPCGRRSTPARRSASAALGGIGTRSRRTDIPATGGDRRPDGGQGAVPCGAQCAPDAR